MAGYEVQIDCSEVITNLQKIKADIRKDVAVKAVNAGGIQIENKARMNAPVMIGNLRNSAHTISRKTREGAEAEIGFRGLAYANIQEFGGTIRARNKPYLTFRINGRWIRKKQVTIHGKHYLERAIQETPKFVIDAMGDVVKRYLENF